MLFPLPSPCRARVSQVRGVLVAGLGAAWDCPCPCPAGTELSVHSSHPSPALEMEKEQGLMDEQSEMQSYYMWDLVSPGAGTGAGAVGVEVQLWDVPSEQEPSPGY